MPAPIEMIKNWRDSRIDAVIDVRSPAEFADDHIAGAINLPVFSNEQRADIGTIYKQVSSFEARRKGASLVSQNIAAHITESLSDKPENWRPLIHCWRGGQRSRAFAHICAEIGWACFLLEGGYKTYRGAVMDELRAVPEKLDIRLISGATGVGKTRLLHALKAQNAQIIDLEDLAAHRGSLLGAMPDNPQPSQRLFESRLNEALSQIDQTRPVYLEAESSRIGSIALPKELWQAMRKAKIIEIEAELSDRLIMLKHDYPHLLTKDAEALHQLINGMVQRHGYETVNLWQGALVVGDFDSFISQILNDHYDPAYQRTSARHNRVILQKIKLNGSADDDFSDAANNIVSQAN